MTAPPLLLLTYEPAVVMTEALAEECKKSVDDATWEAWRNNHVLSIIHSRRRMN